MYNHEGNGRQPAYVNLSRTFFDRKLTQHLPYGLVIDRLSKHFHRLVDVSFFLIAYHVNLT